MMDRSWLALNDEAAIEAELEIVDPHHHMWDTESKYGLYDLDDLRLDTEAGHNVVQTVFIDCGANYRPSGPERMKPVGETEFIVERARRSETTQGATIAAIVSHADLTLGAAVGEVLEAHVAAADGRFRGIRHSGARADDPAVPISRVEPPAELYARDDFRAGARMLAEMGLSFEAWQYHHQLAQVTDLARALPELSIVVNHVGGPLGIGRYEGKFDEVHADLRTKLRAMGELENVSLKLGGIGMTRFGTEWQGSERPPGSDRVVEVWGDTLRWSIDTFGPDRCMFESNYPVDGETTSYTVLWNAFKKISAGYSKDERSDLFAGTARRVYQLEPVTAQS